MPRTPRPGGTPTVTAVAKFLGAAGFQHSRYVESLTSPDASGFKVGSWGHERGRKVVTVSWNEGFADFAARMVREGVQDVTQMPEHPRARALAREYAAALAPRYTVDLQGTRLYVYPRPELPVRPPGVPTARTVRAALAAAGVADLDSDYAWRFKVVDQPDHTRVAVQNNQTLTQVWEALDAEGWTHTVTEGLQHYAVMITGAKPDRPARLRALRKARAALTGADRAPEPGAEAPPEPASVPGERASLGSYVAWAEGPQERTEFGHVVGERNDEVLVLGLDGGFRQMPADIPEAEPEPAPARPESFRSASGAVYAVGMRVTYRTQDGMWQHGEITKIDTYGRTGKRYVYFEVDARQVAPARRSRLGVDNRPGRRRPVPGHRPMVVELDDKDLMPEIREGEQR